ncbi:MAG: hypothetical protein ACEQSQ_10000 [Candidatus Paceibacteria bacterium]
MSLEIMQLEEIQKLYKKLNELKEKKQSNDKLIECLNNHYKLCQEEIGEILKVVIGKKKINDEDEKEFKDIKEKLIAYYTITGITEMPKDGKIIEYKELKSKIANKLSKLRKDAKKDLKTKNKEVDTNLPIATNS